MSDLQPLRRSVGRRRLSARKRWVFRLIMLTMLIVVAEILSWLTLYLLGAPLTSADLRDEQKNLAKGSAVSDGATEAIHPYLGWVRNPQLALPEKHGTTEILTNSHGFLDNGPALRQRSPDRFVIGITGGSVAWHFSWEAEQRLKQHIQTLPQLRNKAIEFVRLAMPGYKQPQQLMTLNYVMALGAEFDLVINIDGFNDGVLSIIENVDHGTALEYPRSWHARARVMADPQVSDQAFRLLTLRAKRISLAKQALTSWCRWMRTYQMVWFVRDQQAQKELIVLGMEAHNTFDKSFLYHGPAFEKKTDHEHRQDAARLWARCSRQMHDLCTASRTGYLHVLQPNQYVKDSKPLSEFELEKCYAKVTRLAETTREVYPELVKEGLRLREQGVAFSDQSMVFRNVTESLYIDLWCHFNQKGNELLADAIFKQIQQNSLVPEGSLVPSQ